MLHYQNGRFSQNGVSFTLPQEFYFDSYDDEVALENGIRVLSGDRTYYVQFALHNNRKSTSEDLEQLWRSGSAAALSDLEAIRHNGLPGHQAYYAYSDGMQYFEMCLALPLDMQFSLTVETDGKDIFELVRSEEIQTLLRDIRAE